MQQLIKITRGLSSPALLLAGVWCAILIGVAVGPIDFPRQPSVPVLVLIAAGVSLFFVGQLTGAWCFGRWLQPRPNPPAPPLGILNVAVVTSAVLGVAGMALIVFDRMVLSGIGTSGYAELLRCAPTLVDFIEIKRTPLLYLGYLTFSCSFASLVLFVLYGEDIRGWPAALAQLSFLAPIGYALAYSGRMPILLAIVLIIAAVLVRIGQGRCPLPHGHHLLTKTIAVVVLFGIYTNASWSNRRDFCAANFGLIEELRSRASQEDAERNRLIRMRREQNPTSDPKTNVPQEPAQPSQSQSADSISAAELNEMLNSAKASPRAADGYMPDLPDPGALVLMYQDAWHTSPRIYVRSAVESGWLSPRTASNLLNTYFYITHGVYVLDLAWHARAQFSPHWGVYQIGVLSPILRIFWPQNRELQTMDAELKAATVYGVFPTVWAAAYIDFGAAGAVIYILIWGFAAGWTALGARHSRLATPPMLLTFILASILLSPVQGPLGIANSALILVSIAIVGLAVDFAASRKRRAELEPEMSGRGKAGAP